MPDEAWQYDPRWNTSIDLDGCQFGFEMDGRCNAILCKFRTLKRLAPEKPRETCKILCPREMEYEPQKGTPVCGDKPTVV